MKRSTISILVALVAMFGTRYAIQQYRAEKKVKADLVTSEWTTQDICDSALRVSLPAPLEPDSVDLPEQAKSRFSKIDVRSSKARGFQVSVWYGVLKSDYVPSLLGAVEGAISQIRSVRGTEDVEVERTTFRLPRFEAKHLDMRIHRKGAPPLRYRAIVAVDGSQMIQLMAIYLDGQPIADQAWTKVVDSISSY